MRVVECEIIGAELPFKKPFGHAAAVRSSSSTVFLRCVSDNGSVGFGECLPRSYVTGETQQSVANALTEELCPHLLAQDFRSFGEVIEFLETCSGSPPPCWVSRPQSYCAAWCSIDLALLDCFGRASSTPVKTALAPDGTSPVNYSAVLSIGTALRLVRSLSKIRLGGLKRVKLKAANQVDLRKVRLVKLVLGRGSQLRLDANMAWTYQTARELIPLLKRSGISAFEQPLAKDDLEGAARLIMETGADIVADESFSDAESLNRIIEARACTAVNIRISKCGGLVAALARAREASAAGLGIQIGCQVGESSLLSAANVILLRAMAKDADWAEGCFGSHLLREDPFTPMLQFGRGGTPPALPPGPGFGLQMKPKVLSSIRRESVRVSG